LLSSGPAIYIVNGKSIGLAFAKAEDIIEFSKQTNFWKIILGMMTDSVFITEVDARM